MHWADVVADRLARRGGPHLIATGITPSGDIHVGNLREVLTGDILRRACVARGLEVELVYIIDSADPLARFPGHLDSATWTPHLGRPFATLPAPDGSDRTWAEYFAQPFLEAIADLGVEARVVDNHAAYRDGHYATAALTFIERRDEVREILERVSGRELPADWFPWQPHGSDGSLREVVVTGWDGTLVHWRDGHGVEGTSDPALGEGKLPWRLDWPARWAWLGVTCEPFGKDHASPGGSYSTGRELVRLLGAEAPEPVEYEWFHLKGKGTMSSSKGIALSAASFVELVPPEVARYLFTRLKPAKSFDFDPGAGLLTVADEYERLEARWVEELRDLPRPAPGEREEKALKRPLDDARSFELAQLPGTDLASLTVEGRVSFAHLATVVQVKPTDDEVWASLARTHGVDPVAVAAQLRDRVRHLRAWVASEHCPPEQRIELRTAWTDAEREAFDPETRALLSAFGERLAEVDWEANVLQTAVAESAQMADAPVRHAFRALYQLLIGRDRGPRAGSFLATLEREDVLALIDAALA